MLRSLFNKLHGNRLICSKTLYAGILSLSLWYHNALLMWKELCSLQGHRAVYSPILQKTECLTELDLISSEFTVAEETDRHCQVSCTTSWNVNTLDLSVLCYHLIWCLMMVNSPIRCSRWQPKKDKEQGEVHSSVQQAWMWTSEPKVSAHNSRWGSHLLWTDRQAGQLEGMHAFRQSDVRKVKKGTGRGRKTIMCMLSDVVLYSACSDLQFWR